jgi:hypothetical protein
MAQLDDRGIVARFRALGPTQPPIEWVPGGLSPGVNRPGRGAGHTPRYSDVFMAWSLVKHRDRCITERARLGLHGAACCVCVSRVAQGATVGSRLGASLPPLREQEVAGLPCFPRDPNPHPGKTLSLGASLVAGSGRDPTCAEAFWKMPHKGESEFHATSGASNACSCNTTDT